MDAEKRQIYRSASGGKRLINNTRQTDSSVGVRYDRRVKQKVENSFQQNFSDDIDESQMQEVAEELSKIEELEAIANSTAKVPSFPLFTFYIALVLDVLDLADFSGIGWVIMSLIEIIFTIILFFLMWRKMSSIFKYGSYGMFRKGGLASKKLGLSRKGEAIAQTALKKVVNKYMAQRLIGTLLLNVIPVLGIFASQAFFVFLAHNKQKKVAKAYIYFVEEVSKILKEYYRRVKSADSTIS